MAENNQALMLVLCIVFGGMCAIVGAGIATFAMVTRRRGRRNSTE